MSVFNLTKVSEYMTAKERAKTIIGMKLNI